MDADFIAFARNLPLCPPGTRKQPSPYPNVNGCRTHDGVARPDIHRWGTQTAGRWTPPSLLSTALAGHIADVTVSIPRHLCCERASLATGTGRDFKQNFPTTGGDNWGSNGWLRTPPQPPSPFETVNGQLKGILLNSLINFFPSSSQGGDEAGVFLQYNPNIPIPCYNQPCVFSDDVLGGLIQDSHFPLEWSTWYAFFTASLNDGTWVNYVLYPDLGWHEYDRRTGKPVKSTGLDHGLEACGNSYTYNTIANAEVGQKLSASAAFTRLDNTVNAFLIQNSPLAAGWQPSQPGWHDAALFANTQVMRHCLN